MNKFIAKCKRAAGGSQCALAAAGNLADEISKNKANARVIKTKQVVKVVCSAVKTT